MVRLRFVEEYKGRRIVTNGTLYGIQGELITDCRYLSPTGARMAIDSEKGIAQRGKYFDWCAQVMKSAGYFSDYKARSYACECGWSGTYDELAKKDSGVVDCSCPTCAAHLLLVTYPSPDDIKTAAEDGHAAAIAMLPGVVEAETLAAEWARQALRKLSQLPDVAGDELAFVWDFEADAGDNYYVIRMGNQIVWRERSRVEDWDRFEPVKRLFKKKYGARFRSLTATDAAKKNLLGDNRLARLKFT